MVLSMTHLSHDLAFDGFLSAGVGEDRRGAEVTFLSMLARLGVDPWIEASELAVMSEVPASKRLDALIAQFKDVPALFSDRGNVTLELLALLPRKRLSANTTSQVGADRSHVPIFNVPIYWIIAAIWFFGWISNLAMGQ